MNDEKVTLWAGEKRKDNLSVGAFLNGKERLRFEKKNGRTATVIRIG